jgi:hypothetical protein
MKRFLSYDDLLAQGIFSNRMSVPRRIATGFPAPIELGPNSLRWDWEEVEQWIESRPRRHPKGAEKMPVRRGDVRNNLDKMREKQAAVKASTVTATTKKPLEEDLMNRGASVERRTQYELGNQNPGVGDAGALKKSRCLATLTNRTLSNLPPIVQRQTPSGK